jgi:hypothetical protein
MSTETITCPPQTPADVPDLDEYLTLAQAARPLPAARGERRRKSRGKDPSCLWRWSYHGCAADDGVRVYLRTAQLGAVTVTTRRWLANFFEELAERKRRARAAADPAAVAERRRQRDDATRATLLRAGIIDPDGQQPRRRTRKVRQ